MRRSFFLVLLLCTNFCHAGRLGNLYKALPPPDVSINKAYFRSYWSDTKQSVLAPFHWDGKHWIAAAAITGTAAVIYTQDLAIHDLFQKNRTATTSNITKYGLEPWGSGVYSLPLMGLLYLNGMISQNDRSKKVALLGVKAFVVQSIVVQIPKYALQRHRPYQNNPADPGIWAGPLGGITHFTSFPSGHTTTAFAVATVLATEYKDKPIVPILAYTVATFTGLSRIHDNRHWASDVFMGAALGYSIGKLICNRNNWGVSVSVSPASKAMGMQIRIPIGNSKS